jgi:hypothetical protein
MQTPEPEVSSSKTDTSLSELEDYLDELWESYLALLDQYTKAQDEIKRHLNSGFLSLAKAQSSASLGRRYGQDWYDERMKASRKARVLSVSVNDTEDSLSAGLQNLSISLTKSELSGGTTQSDEKISNDGSQEEGPKQQQPSPPGTPEPESQPDQEDEEKSDQTEESKPTNPLRWFGVLVPPELKRAQSAFSAMLEESSKSDEPDETSGDRTQSPITDAVNAARGLRDVEAEIRKTRKAVRKAEKASSAGAH